MGYEEEDEGDEEQKTGTSSRADRNHPDGGIVELKGAGGQTGLNSGVRICAIEGLGYQTKWLWAPSDT